MSKNTIYLVFTLIHFFIFSAFTFSQTQDLHLSISNDSNLFFLTSENYFFDNIMQADFSNEDANMKLGLKYQNRKLDFALPDIPIAGINNEFNFDDAHNLAGLIEFNYKDHIVFQLETGPEVAYLVAYKGILHPIVHPVARSGSSTLLSGSSKMYNATIDHSFRYNYVHYGLNTLFENAEIELYTGTGKMVPKTPQNPEVIQFYGAFQSDTLWGAFVDHSFTPDISLKWSGDIHFGEGKVTSYYGSVPFVSLETDDYRLINTKIELSLFEYEMHYAQHIITIRNGHMQSHSAPVSPLGSLYRIDNYYDSLAADVYVHNAGIKLNYIWDAFKLGSTIDYYQISLNHAFLYTRMEGSIITSPVVLNEQRAFNERSHLLFLDISPSWSIDNFSFGCSLKQIIPIALNLPPEINDLLPDSSVQLLGFNASVWVEYSFTFPAEGE